MDRKQRKSKTESPSQGGNDFSKKEQIFYCNSCKSECRLPSGAPMTCKDCGCRSFHMKPMNFGRVLNCR